MKKNSFIDMHKGKTGIKKIYLLGFTLICIGIICLFIPIINKSARGKIEEQLIDDFFADASIKDTINTNSINSTNMIDNQIASVRYIDANPSQGEVEFNGNTTTANTSTQASLEPEYQKYNMVVEVARVGIKKGIYPLSSPYNNIKYNVQLMETSTMPDCKNGNVILAAHNGNSSVSYFDNLKNSKLGDVVNLYYRGIKYTYNLVDIYDVSKKGTVEIKRDHTKSCVTLITCKSKDKTKQVVYIGELQGTEQY